MTGCGGSASYYGPCGAYDCPSCYPISRFPEDEDESDTVLACADATWFPVGTLFETRRDFREACLRVYGRAPNLQPLDGGAYDYAAMRWVLRVVDRPLPEDEPTEEMTLALG